MSTPITAQEVIAANVMTGNPQGARAKHIAEQVLNALFAAGFEVIAPQDLSWGHCPMNDEPDGPHVVATNLCTFCLQYDPE